MTTQQTRTMQRPSSSDATAAVHGAETPSPLLQQAHGWANVARQANDDCVKGAEAERAMVGRRNTPGQ